MSKWIRRAIILFCFCKDVYTVDDQKYQGVLVVMESVNDTESEALTTDDTDFLQYSSKTTKDTHALFDS